MPHFIDASDLTREDVVNQILASIAMEELGLSHIINAEGEKLQYILGTLSGSTGVNPTIDEVLKVNESVQMTLSTALQNQMFLNNKMTTVLNSAVLTGPTGPTGPRGATGGLEADYLFQVFGQEGTKALMNYQDGLYFESDNIDISVTEGGSAHVFLHAEQITGPTGVTGAAGPEGPAGVKGPTGIAIVVPYEPDVLYEEGQLVEDEDGLIYLVNKRDPVGPPADSPDFTLMLRNGGTAPIFAGTERSLVSTDKVNIEVPYNENVIFNTTIYDGNPNVTYNMVTGEFTMEKVGCYLINWWVAVDHTSDYGVTSTGYFAVMKNGTAYSKVSFPCTLGYIVPAGSTFINVDTLPAVITLTNITTNGTDEIGIFLGLGDIQADILITQVA